MPHRLVRYKIPCGRYKNARHVFENAAYPYNNAVSAGTGMPLLQVLIERTPMADIQMRFHRDMLVLSAPVAAALSRQGVNIDADLEFMNLIEPDSVQDVLRMEKAAGACVLVLPTGNMTPAQLAQRSMEDRAFELSVAALTVAKSLHPQHVLVELVPCGLPLDASNKDSLLEHKDQYVRTARVFEKSTFDAYFLNDFTDTVALKCALMGLRQVSDCPVFASVTVDEQGNLLRRGTLEEAAALMQEYGASVVGFTTGASLDAACALAHRLAQASTLPLLVQLSIACKDPKQGEATADNPYYCADTMVQAALRLRSEGVQFLRAVGDASPAYTGALAATVSGLDVLTDIRQ